MAHTPDGLTALVLDLTCSSFLFKASSIDVDRMYAVPAVPAYGCLCRILLYYYTQLPEDKDRMMRMPGASEGWPLEVEAFGKGGQFETAPWHTWAVDGGSPDYPIEVQTTATATATATDQHSSHPPVCLSACLPACLSVCLCTR
jgi:hypothetical protein